MTAILPVDLPEMSAAKDRAVSVLPVPVAMARIPHVRPSFLFADQLLMAFF